MRAFSYGFFVALLLAWVAAYFVWLRPWLIRYRRTAGVMAAIERREAGGLAWLMLKLHGARTTLLLAATSLVTGGWGAVETGLGVDPSVLAPFQDAALWRVVLRDEAALRAAALATLAAAILTLRARLRDIRTVPHDSSDEAEGQR